MGLLHGEVGVELGVLGGLHVQLGLVLVQPGQLMIYGGNALLFLVEAGDGLGVLGGLHVQPCQVLLHPGQLMFSLGFVGLLLV